MSATLGSLFRKATDLLGISSPDRLRPPPLDGEIIYCKNNVCVHPPAVLRNEAEHHPGYLNIRSQDDEVLGSTLILTWIPNSTLKRNPRSIENSPVGPQRKSPHRKSPRQEYAKVDYPSPGSLAETESLASSPCDSHYRSLSRQSSQSSMGDPGEIAIAMANGTIARENARNNAKCLQDQPKVPGVGQNVNDIHKNTNASRDICGQETSESTPPSSDIDSSASPTTEKQLYMLLNRGKLQDRVKERVSETSRERTSSSRSVTSIEMDGDNLVVVTEEIDDSAFLDDEEEEELNDKKLKNVADESKQAGGDADAVSSPPETAASNLSSPRGDHYLDLLRGIKSSAMDNSTDTLTNSTDTLISSFHTLTGSKRLISALVDIPPSSYDDSIVTSDGVKLSSDSGISSDDKHGSTDNLNVKKQSSVEENSSHSVEKLKESLDLKLDLTTVSTDFLSPEISVTGESPPASPGSSSATSGPDSRPPTPVTPPPFPGSPFSGESIPTDISSSESMPEVRNMQFPHNSVSYGRSQSAPGSEIRTAKDQICGVFSVDIGMMRSLRIFYSDQACSSGQLVIASRESQYKVLHFHHGGLDRLSETFDDWKFLAQAKEKILSWTMSPRRKRRQAESDDRSRHFSVIRPYLPNEQSHPEEGAFETVNVMTWKQHMNETGQLLDDFHLRKVIFFAGLEPELRPEMWPFLLHYYPYTSTYEEREQLRNDKYIEYQNIRKQRECMEGEEKEQFWRSVQCTVEKDVIRTDRSHPYFKGENNPNIEILKNILLNYAVAHPHYGYTQGMSDLLAPVLAEVQHEADAYWCFVGLMQKTIFVSSPKDVDMDKQLLFLRELLRIMLTRFYVHLQKLQDGMELLFCHRWILLCFKREFSEVDAMRIWEACWAHYQTDYFHLFVCVAIMAVYGEDVVQQDLPADEMLLHFSSLAMHMNGEVVLRKARSLLHQFRILPKIPCTLNGLCTLCGPGMWDSGHVPIIECCCNHDELSCPYGGKDMK